MIKDYGVFNNRDLDELTILFLDLSINHQDGIDNVTVLYHDTTICGYLIKEFHHYAKIKYDGILFLPNKPLIDIINAILIKNNLETIQYKDNSGYIVSNIDQKNVVICKKGTFLKDKTIAIENHICSYNDLCINDRKDILYLENSQNIGSDFFLTEVEKC